MSKLIYAVPNLCANLHPNHAPGGFRIEAVGQGFQKVVQGDADVMSAR